jgi:hypothetical protein
VITGAYELWPPGRLFILPGKVVYTYLPIIVPRPGESKDEIRLRTRRVFLNAIGKGVRDPDFLGGHTSMLTSIKCIGITTLFWGSLPALGRGFGQALTLLASSLQCSLYQVYVGGALILCVMEIIMFLTC